MLSISITGLSGKLQNPEPSQFVISLWENLHQNATL